MSNLYKLMNFVSLFLLCALLCTFASAQDRNISGKVTSATDISGIPGVNVVEKGTTNGTVTDIEGNFRIIVNQDATIVVSFVGFESQEIQIGSQTSFDVILIEDAEALEEVVVNALGFKQDRNKLGSTSSQVKANDVVRSGETGLLNGLSGKAAGVRIARSNGDPGAGSTIQIRGANTITGSSDPLFIVDGIPVSNSTFYGSASGRSAGTSQQSRINDINPEDIESIQVLKGASAAALWGSRAANGVVVITTKKGKAGDKININFNSTYSIDQINRRHELQDKFGQGTGGIFESGNAKSWGDRISDRTGGADEVDLAGAYFEAEDGTLYHKILKKNSKETFIDKNFNAIFGYGHFFDNSLSFSGGSDKSNFYFSLGDLNQKGIIRNADYRRTTVRLNSNNQMTKWLSVSSNSMYTRTSSNRIQQSSNVNGLYLGLLRGAPDFDNTHYKGIYVDKEGNQFHNRQRTYRRVIGENQNATFNNPLWTVNELSNPSIVDRFLISSEMTLYPANWMDITLRGGVDGNTDRREVYFPVGSSGGDRQAGEFRKEEFKELQINFDGILRISNRKIGENINFNATIGWNVNDRKYFSEYISARQFLINTDLRNVNNSTIHLPQNYRSQRRSYRQYGVLAFEFFDKVFLNINGAREVASTIRGAFFYPAADVAWQFVNSSNSILSFGKLRLAYGRVGVQPGVYKSQTTYEQASYNAYDDGLNPLSYGGGFRYNDNRGNDKLAPEIKTEFEIGTDLRLFKNKLSLGVTYYSNEIKDILFEVGLAPSFGFTSTYANAGIMTNRGLEIELGYTAFKNKDWQIDFFANYNNNRNKVVDLKGTTTFALTSESISPQAVVGQPLSVFWSSRAKRDDGGNLELDSNGFPQLDDNQGVVGNPNPKWRGGFGMTTRYRDFSFNILFETYQKADFADRTRFVLYQFGTHGDVGNEVTLTQDIVNYNGTVFHAGETVRGTIEDFGAGPVLKDEQWYTTIGGGLGGSVINEFAISDGSWTRLRELSLSYSLNPAILKRIKLTKVEVGVTGRNLILWTKVKGIDPEINQSGVDNGFGIEYFTNPSTRSYVFSLKITY